MLDAIARATNLLEPHVIPMESTRLTMTSTTRSTLTGPLSTTRECKRLPRVENEERITKMCKDEPLISEAMAAAIAETLSTSPLPIFKGLTLEEFLQLAIGPGPDFVKLDFKIL